MPFDRDALTTQLRKHTTVNDETGCWDWSGKVDRYGYGLAWSPRTQAWRIAHRWSYEYLTEEELGDMTLDHLCHNRLCVNPDHVEVVSLTVNSTRANEFRWHGTIHERGDGLEEGET